MGAKRRDLPVIEGDSPSACTSVRGGLSDEEAALAERLRELRRSAQRLRRAMANAEPDAARSLAARLETLRRERAELAAAREDAYRRKMIALGHLDPG